ncbi:hypothetical protein B0O99DRAFT_598467 [Bisporella sp. PMI_857]|nr:hypothetical protein B0O99DRAFT_598467 [Bisporella sp. PMI_857]
MKPVTPGIVPIPDNELDHRTDDEIIAYLKNPPPIRGERNVWAFWDSGFDNIRPWCQRNVLGWSRRYIGQCLTGFIAARKENPFIERWMRVWQELWKGDRTNCFGLHAHPLLKHLGLIMPPDLVGHEKPRHIDMGGEAESFDLKILTDYLALNMAYERVRLLKDPLTGWDGPQYFRKHIHLMDTIDELWKSHEMLLQDELFPLLSLPFEPEEVDSDPQQKAASDYVGYVLANCSMAKFSQGHWQPGGRIPLAMSWSMSENVDADIKKGTWSEYLRWASLSCNQQRCNGLCLESVHLPEEKDEVLTTGLFEAK